MSAIRFETGTATGRPGCAVNAGFYLPWLAWREKRLNQERVVCQRLLDDLRA